VIQVTRKTDGDGEVDVLRVVPAHVVDADRATVEVYERPA
jgi:hypothetical protein